MVYLHIRHRPIYNGNAPYNEKTDSIDVDDTMFDDDSRLLLPIFYTDIVLFILLMLHYFGASYFTVFPQVSVKGV